MTQPHEPIEDYLDELLTRLAGPPRQIRRMMTETEEHLRSSADRLEADGMDRVAAEEEAVRRFGRPEVVSPGLATRLIGLIRSAIGLVGVGLVAIGVSGLVAELFGRIWGAEFVSGDLPGTTYTTARCQDFVGFFPGHSCLEAAALHHWGEVVMYRVAVGVLGVLVLGLYWILRRPGTAGRGLVDLIGTVLFGGAAGVLGAVALNTVLAGRGVGLGAPLSAAVVAALVACFYGVGAWRFLRSSYFESPMGVLRID
jgi:hypothetical protein